MRLSDLRALCVSVRGVMSEHTVTHTQRCLLRLCCALHLDELPVPSADISLVVSGPGLAEALLAFSGSRAAAHVGECWPGSEFKFSNTVEVRW